MGKSPNSSFVLFAKIRYQITTRGYSMSHPKDLVVISEELKKMKKETNEWEPEPLYIEQYILPINPSGSNINSPNTDMDIIESFIVSFEV